MNTNHPTCHSSNFSMNNAHDRQAYKDRSKTCSPKNKEPDQTQIHKKIPRDRKQDFNPKSGHRYLTQFYYNNLK